MCVFSVKKIGRYILDDRTRIFIQHREAFLVDCDLVRHCSLRREIETGYRRSYSGLSLPYLANYVGT